MTIIEGASASPPTYTGMSSLSPSFIGDERRVRDCFGGGRAGHEFEEVHGRLLRAATRDATDWIKTAETVGSSGGVYSHRLAAKKQMPQLS